MLDTDECDDRFTSRYNMKLRQLHDTKEGKLFRGLTQVDMGHVS